MTASEYGKAPPKWLLRLLTRVNLLVYSASGGRWMSALAGRDICFVTMTGSRTCKPRRVPLLHIPHEDGVILVASQGGADTHPAWYHNLIKTPAITVEVRGARMVLSARLATPEGKARLWATCVAHYPPYETYQRRTRRDIPVFICR